MLWIALWLGSGSAGAVEGPAVASPLSPEGLQALTDRVVPMVERHAGKPFLERPTVALAEGEAFRTVVREEVRLIIDRVFAASPEAVRARMAEEQSWGTALAVLGKYGIQTDTLYMSPEPLKAADARIEGHDLEAIVTVILAHELTHALQDQHTPFEGLLATIRDEDHLHAASGSWEGFATRVEQKVAHELGLDDLFWELTALQGWGADGLQEPLAFQTWATYGQGRTFIEHHEAHGNDHLWGVLAQPPSDSAMLFRPERYRPEIAAMPIDYGPALLGAQDKLTSKREWATLVTRVGELELREEAMAGHTDAELEALTPHLVHAQKLAAVLPDRAVEARLMRFDDPAWSARYLAMLQAQADGRAAAEGDRYRVDIQVTHEPFEVPSHEVDQAVLRTVRRPIGGGRHLETRAAVVVRGDLVLVVSAEHFRPGLRMGWAVDHVLANLDAMASE